MTAEKEGKETKMTESVSVYRSNERERPRREREREKEGEKSGRPRRRERKKAAEGCLGEERKSDG